MYISGKCPSEISIEDFGFDDFELGKNIVLWWNEDGSQEKIEYLSDYVENIPKMLKYKKYKWLSEIDLLQEKWVIFDSSHTGYPPSYDCKDVSTTPEYFEKWIEWTVRFACENEYTGYSSVNRWSTKTKNPLFGLEERVCPQNDQEEKCIIDAWKKRILSKLEEEAQNNGDCPGLRAVPDGVWWISDSDWRKVWKVDD